MRTISGQKVVFQGPPPSPPRCMTTTSQSLVSHLQMRTMGSNPLSRGMGTTIGGQNGEGFHTCQSFSTYRHISPIYAHVTLFSGLLFKKLTRKFNMSLERCYASLGLVLSWSPPLEPILLTTYGQRQHKLRACSPSLYCLLTLRHKQ